VVFWKTHWILEPEIVTDQSQPSEVIFFRSQTKRFLVPLAIAFGLGGIIVLGIFYLSDIQVLHLNDNLDPLTWKQYLAIVIGLPLVYLFACLVFLSQPGVGSYRIDHDGIEQNAFQQTTKHLKWQDTERVKWGKDLACFEGKGASISILWTLISTKDELLVRPFLEKVLSAEFDVSVKPVRQWPISLISLGVGVAAIMIAIIAVPNRLFPTSCLILICILLSCLVLWRVRQSKEQRRIEQINPTWRFRRKQENSS
jgi:hypothetical protein